MKETNKHVVCAQQQGLRVDKYLLHHYPTYSRSYFKKLIEKGLVVVNSKNISKSSHIVKEHDAISVTFAVSTEITTTPLETPFEVIDEQPDFLVINKPAGLIVHNATSNPDAPSLVRGLLARYPEFMEFNESVRPGIVHRLDKDTSGIILVARNTPAQIALANLFKDRTITKTYLALTQGTPEKTFTVDFNIGRHPHIRYKMTHRNGIASRPAKTLFSTLMYYNNAALVQASPITGRTHQIRVHLAAAGHSIVGDSVYGQASPYIARQALHAWKISFVLNGKPYSYQAPLPTDMEHATKALYAE